MTRLSSLDAQFLAVEDGRNHAHVAHLGIYGPSAIDGRPMDVDVVRDLIRQRMPALGPLAWRLEDPSPTFGHPRWVPAGAIDLHQHVTEHPLTSWDGDHSLDRAVAILHGRPLDRGRPLWEIVVIPGLPEGRVAVLTKIHHALVDGVSGAALISVLLDRGPQGRDVEAWSAGVPEPRRSRVRSVTSALLDGVRQPLRGARGLRGVVTNLDQIVSARAVPGATTVLGAATRVLGTNRHERPPATAPRTSFNHTIGSERIFARASLPLSALKAVGTARGATVNDVFVAACAGALRTYLQRRDELPDQPLIAMIPTSTRTAADPGYGNRISTIVVGLPTHHGNPVQRVDDARRVLGQAKQRARELPDTLLRDGNDLVPPSLLGTASRALGLLASRSPTGPPVNVVLSSVPGPADTFYCAGSPMVQSHPVSAIIDGVALNITALRYEGHLDIGLVGDPALTPDIQDLANDLRDELTRLETATRSAANRAAADHDGGPLR